MNLTWQKFQKTQEYYYGPPIRIGDYEYQMFRGIVLRLPNPSWGSFLIPAYLIVIEPAKSGHIAHIDCLTYKMKIIVVAKTKLKPFELCLPKNIENLKTILCNERF